MYMGIICKMKRKPPSSLGPCSLVVSKLVHPTNHLDHEAL